MPRATLNQWKTLLALVDQRHSKGAAQVLGRTQSAVSHAIAKLELTVGQTLCQIRSGGVELTALGDLILPRIRKLINDADRLEEFCTLYGARSPTELSVAVDMTMPTDVVHQTLLDFSKLHPFVRLRIHETALSGGRWLMERDIVDVAIAATLPPSMIVEALLSVRFLCVAASDHPLHEKSVVEPEDLTEHCQIVIADTNRDDPQSSGWLEAHRRWTVGHIETSRRMLIAGDGFAWFPEDFIREDLRAGRLRQIKMRDCASRVSHLHLGYRDMTDRGPYVRDFVAILRDAVHDYCDVHDEVTK